MDGATITAVALFVVALTGAFTAWNQRRIREELKTMNAGTVGTFASDDETRRVERIPYEERTPTEQTHLDEAPPKEAAQGPAIKAIYDAVNGTPSDHPTLYDVVATLDLKVDHNHVTLMERFDQLERRIGGD